VAELETATSSETVDPLPGTDEEAPAPASQAEGESEEQAEEAESAIQPPEAGEEDEIFGDLEEEKPEADPLSEIDWSEVLFEVQGEEEPVSLQELVDGRMRQRDYTQKTQEIASQRKENEQAVRFWEQLQANPAAVVRQLAVEAGLIEQGQQPVAQIEVSPFRTTETVEAEIQKRVAEEVGKHPSVLEAQKVAATQRMNAEFAEIEEKHGVKLGPDSRRRILVEAQRNGTPNLELVFQALLAQKQQRAAEAEKLRAGAPSRSTGRATERTVDEPPTTLEEAWALAEVSHGMRG
jgi:hypothetical protein